MKLPVILFVLICVVAGCSDDNQKDTPNVCTDPITCDTFKLADLENGSRMGSDVEKIEIYHFHGTNQCFSCRTVGAFAEKTVNTYYKDILDSGKMAFASINAELPENRDLAIKYGATGSSLWIGTYIRGELHKEENVNVWYKVNDEADYISYLKSIIDKRLAGDLS